MVRLSVLVEEPKALNFDVIGVDGQREGIEIWDKMARVTCEGLRRKDKNE